MLRQLISRIQHMEADGTMERTRLASTIRMYLDVQRRQVLLRGVVERTNFTPKMLAVLTDQ
jgi:hypothetical protein